MADLRNQEIAREQRENDQNRGGHVAENSGYEQMRLFSDAFGKSQPARGHL